MLGKKRNFTARCKTNVRQGVYGNMFMSGLVSRGRSECVCQHW